MDAFAREALGPARDLASRLVDLHTYGGAAVALCALIGIAAAWRGGCRTFICVLGIGLVAVLIGATSLAYGIRLSVLLGQVPHRGDAPILITLRPPLMSLQTMILSVRWVGIAVLALAVFSATSLLARVRTDWVPPRLAGPGVLALGIAALLATRGYASDNEGPVRLVSARSPGRQMHDSALARPQVCSPLPECNLLSVGPELLFDARPITTGDLRRQLEAARRNGSVVWPGRTPCMVLEIGSRPSLSPASVLRTVDSVGIRDVYLLATRARTVHTETWGDRRVFEECVVPLRLVHGGSIPVEQFHDGWGLVQAAAAGLTVSLDGE